MAKKERYHINLIGGGPGKGRGIAFGKRGRTPKNTNIRPGRPQGGGGKGRP